MKQLRRITRQELSIIEHNYLRFLRGEGKVAEIPDLSYCDLSGMDLSGVVLPFANFTSANISRVNLTNAHLYGANFTDAKLTYVIAQEAELDYTLIKGASLSHVDLRKATLKRADFEGACVEMSEVSSDQLENLSFRHALTASNTPNFKTIYSYEEDVDEDLTVEINLFAIDDQPIKDEEHFERGYRWELI